jgi:hypothetical protein
MRTLMAHYLIIGVGQGGSNVKGNQDPQIELLAAERCYPLTGTPKGTKVFFQPAVNEADSGFNIDRWKGLGFNVIKDVAVDASTIHGTDLPDEVLQVIQNQTSTATTDDQVSRR